MGPKSKTKTKQNKKTNYRKTKPNNKKTNYKYKKTKKHLKKHKSRKHRGGAAAQMTPAQMQAEIARLQRQLVDAQAPSAGRAAEVVDAAPVVATPANNGLGHYMPTANARLTEVATFIPGTISPSLTGVDDEFAPVSPAPPAPPAAAAAEEEEMPPVPPSDPPMQRDEIYRKLISYTDTTDKGGIFNKRSKLPPSTLLRELRRNHFYILDKLKELKMDKEVKDEYILFGELKEFDFEAVKELYKKIEAHMANNP